MRKTLTLAALAAFLLLPAAEAGTYGFGSQVAKGDYDYFPQPANDQLGLCYIDSDLNMMYSSGEGLYLTMAGTNLVCGAPGMPTTDDIRLVSAVPGFIAGSQVAMGNGDYLTRTFTGVLPHEVRYFDIDNDAKFKVGKDGLYIDIFRTATPQINQGDLRITPVTFGGITYGAASFVEPTDTDMNIMLSELGTLYSVGTNDLGRAGTVLKAGNGFYINIDGATQGGAGTLALAGADVGTTCTDAEPASMTVCAPALGGVATWSSIPFVVAQNAVGPAACSDAAPATACALPVQFLGADGGIEEHDVRLNAKAETPLADKPLVQVESIELSSDTVVPGAWFQATILVKNNGRGPGAGLVDTSVAGTLLDARGTPTLDPLATAKLVVNLPAPDAVGTYQVTAGETTVILYVETDATTPAAVGNVVDLTALPVQAAPEMQQVALAPSVPPVYKAEVTQQSGEKAPAPGAFLAALAIAGLGLVVRSRRSA